MDPLVLSVLGNAWVKELSSRREASYKGFICTECTTLFVTLLEVKCLDVFLCEHPCVCGQGRGAFLV